MLWVRHAASAPVVSVRVTIVGIGWKPIFIVSGVNLECQHHLAAVIHAFDALGFGFGLAQRGEQHACEDGNNRNHHQKLNQGKTFLESASILPVFHVDLHIMLDVPWLSVK